MRKVDKNFTSVPLFFIQEPEIIYEQISICIIFNNVKSRSRKRAGGKENGTILHRAV